MQQAPAQESSGAAMQEEMTRDLAQATVQSDTTTCAAAAEPASLPNLWLHKLATHVSTLLEQGDARGSTHSTVMAVFRTCTTCRDAVILSRQATVYVSVPILAEDWPDMLQSMCEVLRRSRNVKLVIVRGQHEDMLDWTQTEPHIIHMLLCVRRKLGPTALTRIKAVIVLGNLQLSALVPAWFRELCPSATHLDLTRTRLPAALAPYPAPLPQHSLQTLFWDPVPTLDTSAGPIRRHVRQQLAALPSLTSLTTRDLDWAARPALVSSSLTRLELFVSLEDDQPPPLVHLPAQFPNLRELQGLKCLVLQDDDLHALLSMAHLRTVKVYALALQDSHRGWPWPQRLDLHVASAPLDSLALLPLDRIAKCTIAENMIFPSSDAARAERVAAAFRRWGTFQQGAFQQGGNVLLRVMGADFAATLASLTPFLRAAPPQPITLIIVEAEDVTREEVRRLGALLTADVRTLRFTDSTFAPEAWPRFLSILPPSITTLELAAESPSPPGPADPLPSVEQLRSLCLGATRPVKVVVAGPGAHMRVQRARAGMGNHPAARLVSLVGQE